MNRSEYFNKTIVIFLFAFWITFNFNSINGAVPVITDTKSGNPVLFNSSEIDSITFSKFDVDSILHKDIVSQVVWAGGIPTVIPLNEIQNVSFEAPATVLNAGVREIDSVLMSYISDYIEEENDLVLYLDPSVPNSEIPKPGEYLYTLNTSNLFPLGFMGKAVEVSRLDDSIVARFDAADFTDIFDSFYGNFIASSAELTEEVPDTGESGSRINRFGKNETIDKTFSIDPFSFNIPLGFFTNMDDGINFEGDENLIMTVEPTMRIRTNILVAAGRMSVSTLIVSDFQLTEELELKGSADYEKNFNVFSLKAPIPVAPAVSVKAEGGLRLKLTGELGFRGKFTQNFRLVYHTYLSNYDKDAIYSKPIYVPKDNQIIYAEGYGDVNLRLGTFLQVGVDIGCAGKAKFATITAGIEKGIEAKLKVPVGKYQWDNSEISTDAYRNLSRPDGLTMSLYKDIYIRTTLLKLKWDLNFPLLSDEESLWFSKPILPRFNNLKVSELQYGVFQADALYESGLANVPMGFCMLHIGDETKWDSSYKTDSNNGAITANLLLNSDDATHRIHPFVQFFGKTLLAEPYEEIQEETHNPEASVSDTNFYIITTHTVPQSLDYPKDDLYAEFDVYLTDLETPSPEYGIYLCASAFEPLFKGFSDNNMSLTEKIQPDGSANIHFNLPINILYENAITGVKFSNGKVTFDVPVHFSIIKAKNTRSSSSLPVEYVVLKTFDQTLTYEGTPTHTLSNLKVDYPWDKISFTENITGIVGWWLMHRLDKRIGGGASDLIKILDYGYHDDSYPLSFNTKGTGDNIIVEYLDDMESEETVSSTNVVGGTIIIKNIHSYYRIKSSLLKPAFDDFTFPETEGLLVHLISQKTERYINGNYTSETKEPHVQESKVIKLSDWWQY